MRKAIHILMAICWLATAVHSASGQEKNSILEKLSADFSYGFPTYLGDFSTIFSRGTIPTFRSVPLGTTSQYNLSSFAGSISYDFRPWVTFRLRASQTNIFFSESSAGVNFRNSLVDLSLLAQLRIAEFSRFKIYGYLGPGINTHLDADIRPTQSEAESTPNFTEIRRISATAGLGFQGRVWSRYYLFAEGDVIFTGSDRFDGYNGFPTDFSGDEFAEEEPFLGRDQILTARAGIRVRLGKSTVKVPERKVKDPLVAWLPPDGEADTTAAEKDFDPWEGFGVSEQLRGYTLQVDFVTDTDALSRQKKVADSISDELAGKGIRARVQLLREGRGVSIHIGVFRHRRNAKKIIRDLKNYYSGVLIRNHG